MKGLKQYIGSQEHWEDSVNSDYDQKEAYEKQQVDDREPQYQEPEPEEPLSFCCTAPIIFHDICSNCGEHI